MTESLNCARTSIGQRIWLHILLWMGAICFNTPAIAQVIPDATLGAEQSQVNSNVSVPGGMGDRIDGGALRDANLFHSFQEFNVNTGQRVYFANPAAVQNIFSRVTGGNLSTINGTLGVLGNANLFLLNPNGILFGPNAKLDIRGSFLATTANRFTFPDGSSFGATNPQAAPLLSMSVPVGVQYGATPTGTIQNQGNLISGQDLTLAANNLNLQGQLQAGRDLNLQAQNTVQIRDTTTQPFVARSGRDLTIQGNQTVDILALNHLTQTPFVSGGNTTLISNNPVSADAHFSSGGNFSVQTPAGNINNLISRFDPIFNVAGDYTIGDYTGASLQVTAGGNITFGSVMIDNIDTNVNPDQPAFILNAGGNITGTGEVSTTVPDGNLLVNFTSGGATSVGQITTNGGGVYIQAQGEITAARIDTSSSNDLAGDVHLKAVGNIRTGDIKATGNFADSSEEESYYNDVQLQSSTGSIFLNGANLDTSNNDLDGYAGDIFIDAAKNIEISNSTISTQGNIGRIFIGSEIAPEKVTITNNSELSTDSRLSKNDQNTVDSGPISIQGTTIDISNSNIYTNADNGTAGDVIIQATADNGTAIALTNTVIDAAAFGSEGRTGNITLEAINRGDILLQWQGQRNFNDKIYADTIGNQSSTTGIKIFGGDINIDNYVLDSTVSSSARGSDITIDGHSISLLNGSEIRTDVKSSGGSAGRIGITGDALSLTGGSQISAKVSQYASGSGGAININIRGLTNLSGAETRIANSVEKDAFGAGGLTTIQTNSLFIKDGAEIESSTSGQGNAGNLIIKAQDGVFLQNGNIHSDANSGATGNAGDIEITADRFSMSSPGSATINTRITGRVEANSQGKGGDITINARSATLDNSAISFSTFGKGDAGILTINAQDLTLRSDTAIVGDVGNGGNGRGGEIHLNVAGTLLMDGATDPGVNNAGTGESTRITAGIGPGGSGQGGDIRIATGTFLMQNGAIIKNSTRGSGDAGAVKITAEQVDISGSVPQSGLPSGLFTNTSTDFKAGDIDIHTGTFRISNGSALNAQSTGNGVGGNITVNTSRQFEALTGGQLITSTSGAGAAGDIQVNSPQVKIAGQDPLYEQRLKKFPNPINPGVANAITATGPSSGLFANAIASSSTTRLGKGGDITIKASNVLIQDHAGLKVNSQSANLSANASSSAGTIKITANQLKLDNNTFINAETDNGSGGDIQISLRDLLLMRQNSQISTTAGSPGKGGNGGNIIINAPKGFLVAVPQENSDIIANAFGGKGGTITISANRVFGLQTLSGLSPEQLTAIRSNGTSDISASSDVGQDGQVTISSLQVDPAQGLTELPVDVVDPSSLIAQGCQPDNPDLANRRSEFVITGRGGLPPSAGDPQTGGGISVPWVERTEDSRQNSENRAQKTAVQPESEAIQPSPDQPLVEAQGIVIAPNGTALLTAQVAATAPYQSGLRNIRCRDRNPNPLSPSTSPD